MKKPKCRRCGESRPSRFVKHGPSKSGYLHICKDCQKRHKAGEFTDKLDWGKESPEDRFWAKVKKTRKCWIWTGAKLPTGYGRLGIEYKTVAAHRYSYELHIGTIPDGMFVCHSCDNPPCVRPEHLFLGNGLVNMRDASVKGRILKKTPKFVAMREHVEAIKPAKEKMPVASVWVKKLTPETVFTIRRLFATKNYTCKDLADMFSITRAYVWQIIHYKVWNNKVIKLTPEDVKEIRKLASDGKYNRFELAEMYGLTANYVWKILKLRAWRNI